MDLGGEMTVEESINHSFLKEDFQNYGNEQRTQVKYFTSHVGFQSNKYWILSKQVKFIEQNLYWPNDFFLSDCKIYVLGPVVRSPFSLNGG